MRKSRAWCAKITIAMRILQDNREVLDRLAGPDSWETLDLEQVRSLINGKDIGVPIKAEPIPLLTLAND